jgi:phosphoribosylglycinamide formyltransferase-1
MEAILQAIRDDELAATVEIVLSNNPQAPALEIARSFGVKAEAVDSKGLTRQQHEENLVERLANHSVDYVVMAGYMRILTPFFLKHFQDPAGYYRVVNIHPSLLPAFPGKSAYEEAFEHGVRVSGITVHLVDCQVDHGPILAQEPFPRLDNDSLDSFKSRGLAVEHQLYPAVLQNISQNGIRLLPQATHQKVASK